MAVSRYSSLFHSPEHATFGCFTLFFIISFARARNVWLFHVILHYFIRQSTQRLIASRYSSLFHSLEYATFGCFTLFFIISFARARNVWLFHVILHYFIRQSTPFLPLSSAMNLVELPTEKASYLEAVNRWHTNPDAASEYAASPGYHQHHPLKVTEADTTLADWKPDLTRSKFETLKPCTMGGKFHPSSLMPSGKLQKLSHS